MYCGKCGKLIADSVKFCPFCGEITNKNSNAGNFQYQNQYNPANGFQNQNMNRNQYSGAYQQFNPQISNVPNGNKAKAPKKGHKKVFAVLVAIVILGAGIGTCGLLYIKDQNNKSYQKALEDAKSAYESGDYENAIKGYQSALDYNGTDVTAKEGLDTSNAMMKLDSATANLANLSSYDANVSYEMILDVEDSTNGRSYMLTQSSEMTTSNITDEDGFTIAYVTGDLITSSDDDGTENSQTYELYITKSGSIETNYSYTDSTGWGGSLTTGAEEGNSIILGDIASLSYSYDKDNEDENYYVFTAADVNAQVCDFLTSFCSITDKATDAGNQKMDVYLFVNRESGKVSKIEVSYPNLSMTDVNEYYCSYSGKNLSISLDTIKYTIDITDWDSDENISVPQDAVDALSVGGGLQTAVAFSTEPTEYLGVNMVDGSFNDASFLVPSSWIKYDSSSEGQYYALNSTGSAYVALGYIDKSKFRSSSDSKNMKLIFESLSDDIEVTDSDNVTIDGEKALRFGVTSIGSNASINGVVYVIPCGDGYMIVEYVMYSGVENIWQSQFNAFIESIDI